MTVNRPTTQILILAGPARHRGRAVVRALAVPHRQSLGRAALLVRRDLVQAAVLGQQDQGLAAVPGQAAGRDQAVVPGRALLQLDLVREVGKFCNLWYIIVNVIYKYNFFKMLCFL